ncbi:MAG: alpha-galactosidase [Clostridiales bacterium]|nr:alpha-galactosidase [Clostridiales bacterium]
MSFTDVYFQPGENPVICYRSGLTVYEEAFGGSTLYSCGWNTAGYPLNVLSGCPSRMQRQDFRRPCTFHAELDGVSLDYGLLFSGCDMQETEKGKLVKVKLTSTLKPVEITVVTRLDGTSILSRHLELKNLSERPMALSALSILSGGVEIMQGLSRMCGASPRELYSLGYMDNDETAYEGDFNWHSLPGDVTAFGGRYTRGRHRYPMFMLRNHVMGTIMTAQLAWSGGYEFAFDLNAHPENDWSKLSLSADITGNTPLYQIAPGETFVSPALEIGMLHGDLDDAVNEMNQHLRRSVFTLPAADASDCLIGSGMGAEHDMSVETTKSFIDQMASIGCEVFIVDAGWNCPPGAQGDWYRRAGDWTPDPNRYPNGISEIRDYCHMRGMKFGMWMEAERIGELTAVYREHPQWLTTHPDGRKGVLLDLTLPEAAQWAENEIARVISEYQLDLFRIDYNVMSDELFALSSSSERECLSVRHTNAVYSMYERLKKRFPHVIFENCASGGGRCDAGMMRFFHHTWVSDNQIPPYSQRITNGMTLALPPERVDRLAAGMGCHRAASLDFHMRNVMLGHISMNVFSPRDAKTNPDQLKFIRHSLSVYKNFIRKFLPNSLIYHHTPESASFRSGSFSVLELASCSRDRAAITVLTPCTPASDTCTVFPRGLDPAPQYRVVFDNTGCEYTASGRELAQQGILVRIPCALSSELLLIEKIQP